MATSMETVVEFDPPPLNTPAYVVTVHVRRPAGGGEADGVRLPGLDGLEPELGDLVPLGVMLCVRDGETVFDGLAVHEGSAKRPVV